MICPMASPFLMAQLKESTVAMLMPLRMDEGETLDEIVARIAVAGVPAEPEAKASPEPRSPASEASDQAVPDGGQGRARQGKYRLNFLGKDLHANRLPEIFAAVVDELDDLAPEAVETLADMEARKRRYVARAREMIHRPDLGVLQARSGWWISTNVGTADLVRGLKAACHASGLVYGADIIFNPGD